MPEVGGEFPEHLVRAVYQHYVQLEARHFPKIRVAKDKEFALFVDGFCVQQLFDLTVLQQNVVDRPRPLPPASDYKFI